MTVKLKSIGSARFHTKASEAYVTAEIDAHGETRMWDIPIQYRRTGVDVDAADTSAVETYLMSLLDYFNPDTWHEFREEAKAFWSTKPNASVTKEFFDVLVEDFKYKSQLSDLPQNPNWARRVQDLKEFGFTIATDTSRFDGRLKQKCTHLCLLPIPRGGTLGYENWSPALRKRIVKVLGSFDVFEARKVPAEGLLPDHKFPEIRWDENTRRSSLENLSDQEISRDFQLLSNQRNQQKREACRSCFQTGVRPSLYGIRFFAEGTDTWPASIPAKGKEAEQGCRGCPWYDIEGWRKALNRALTVD